MRAEASFTRGDGLWEHIGSVKIKRSSAHRYVERLLDADPDRFGVRLTVNQGPKKPLLEYVALRALHAGR